VGKVVVFTQPRTIGIDTVEDRALEGSEVRLETLYSGISAGTELTAFRGSNPYMHKQWDEERRIFVGGETRSQQYPIRGWGYEEVGKVVEVGTETSGVKLGDIVYGTWGHRTHHIVKNDYARNRILPAELDPVAGIFSQIGAIALNGVLDAAIRIGETVAVFGLGVPGQIVAQLAKRSGARVIGVDLYQGRRETATACGIDHVLDPREGSAAEAIKALTDGRGADVSIEVSGFAPALHEAIRATAYSAKVVAMGFLQGEAAGLFLGEEFHHNRVNVVCSQISGVAPDLSYRWNSLRLAQTAIRLQAEGTINLLPLISHTFPFAQADEAFALLDTKPAEALQVVLDCRS
jgi:threonine dehydrogenase-like Zn-dependent dehydrogenase